MDQRHPAIVLVGTGNVTQYLAEEFLNAGCYDLHVICRTDKPFFRQPGITLHLVPAYTKDEILPILNQTNATAIISGLASDDPPTYTSLHQALLTACQESRSCKRLIPSEFIGNLREFEGIPRYSYKARNDFRQALKSQSEVKWTLVNQGWLSDYLAHPVDEAPRTYIRPYPQGWPIDFKQKTARVIDSGEHLVTFTACRDMAKAVVQLMSFEDWPDHTYVFGETTTWNKIIGKVEKFHGSSFKRIHQSTEQIEADLAQTEDEARRFMANIDEFSLGGAGAVPQDEALAQRERYFKGIHFRTIDEVLESSKQMQII